MKYRKKPVVIEAMEINNRSELDVRKWAGFAVVYPSPVLEPTDDNPSGTYWQVKTLEGIMTCIAGDFIVRGVKGEFYPCRRDIFLETYEVFEDEDDPEEKEKTHSLYSYFTPDEDLPASLKVIKEALEKIDLRVWNVADQQKRDLMTKEVLGPLNLKGKLSNAEADYLEDCNFHTALSYLMGEAR